MSAIVLSSCVTEFVDLGSKSVDICNVFSECAGNIDLLLLQWRLTASDPAGLEVVDQAVRSHYTVPPPFHLHCLIIYDAETWTVKCPNGQKNKAFCFTNETKVSSSECCKLDPPPFNTVNWRISGKSFGKTSSTSWSRHAIDTHRPGIFLFPKLFCSNLPLWIRGYPRGRQDTKARYGCCF